LAKDQLSTDCVRSQRETAPQIFASRGMLVMAISLDDARLIFKRNQADLGRQVNGHPMLDD
jgi:hypothetical protein